jgi:hypothetical protein
MHATGEGCFDLHPPHFACEMFTEECPLCVSGSVAVRVSQQAPSLPHRSVLAPSPRDCCLFASIGALHPLIEALPPALRHSH